MVLRGCEDIFPHFYLSGIPDGRKDQVMDFMIGCGCKDLAYTEGQPYHQIQSFSKWLDAKILQLNLMLRMLKKDQHLPMGDTELEDTVMKYTRLLAEAELLKEELQA